MTDDLDDLKDLMAQATPRPDDARRTENIALARKNFETLQGSREEVRPNHTQRPNGLWYGVKSMFNIFSVKGGLVATTAIVACGFLVLTPAGKSVWQGPLTVSEADGGVTFEEAGIPEAFAVSEAADLSLDTAVMEEPMVMFEAVPSEKISGRDMIQVAPSAAPLANIAPLPASTNTESYPDVDPHPLKVTLDEPVSTFSIDVDTASYSVVRDSIMNGFLPDPNAVRVEEMVNYFPYDYAAPSGEVPFQPNVSVFPTPWNDGTELVRIGIQGELPPMDDRPPLNLVFLIDTSGSMDAPDKLPLLRQSFALMLGELRPEDQIAIVTYAGSAGVALEPTAASDRDTIMAALNQLSAGGSTYGQGGLETAYALAERMSEDGDVSRILLATDGDFNVGLSDPSSLTDYIAKKRDSGTYLSVLGFGRGNLDDATMQALAQNGNGTAAYIDTLNEAQKVLVDQLSGALFPIADDVKVQVEFNPAVVAEYRLIGFETRALNREDFRNDAVDAGELGAGHQVTALYEITPVGSPARLTDDLRYGAETPETTSDEIGFLRLRWKEPGEDTSAEINQPITFTETIDMDAGFAAAVAGFGQLLQGSNYLGQWSYDDAIALATENRGNDPFGYRAEAIQLMRLAQSLAH